MPTSCCCLCSVKHTSRTCKKFETHPQDREVECVRQVLQAYQMAVAHSCITTQPQQQQSAIKPPFTPITHAPTTHAS
jgi:hypothetical protein